MKPTPLTPALLEKVKEAIERYATVRKRLASRFQVERARWRWAVQFIHRGEWVDEKQFEDELEADGFLERKRRDLSHYTWRIVPRLVIDLDPEDKP